MLIIFKLKLVVFLVSKYSILISKFLTKSILVLFNSCCEFFLSLIILDFRLINFLAINPALIILEFFNKKFLVDKATLLTFLIVLQDIIFTL